MKTRFSRYSACLFALLATGTVNRAEAQLGPRINRQPEINVQSPLLNVASEGKAAEKKDENAKPTAADAKKAAKAEAREAAKIQEPVKAPEPAKPVAKSKAPAAGKPAVQMKEPAPAPVAAAAKKPASSPALVPPANAPKAKPMALTPEEKNIAPLPETNEGAGAGGLLDPNAVFIPKLTGIHLFKDDRKTVTDKPSQVPAETSSGIVIGEGLTTPNPEALIEHLRANYLGKGLSFNILDKIVKDVLEHYSKEQRPTTHVYIPEQEITDKIKIAVLEGRLGEVRYAGNEKRKWYQAPQPKLPATLEAQRGEILNMNSITQAVSDLNLSPWSRLGRLDAHPYRRASLSLTPGSELGLTDVELALQSRNIVPIQAFAGWDNTGTVVLGENRFSFGSVWFDAFNTGYDHQLGFQVQSAENFDLFHAVIASYQIPVRSLNSTIQLYGAFMQSSVDIPAAGVSQLIEGDAYILGGRWFYKLPDWYITDKAKNAQDKSRELALYHEIGFGFDYKNQANNLFFGGVNVFPTKIEVAQYVAEYNLRQTDKWGETSLGLSFFYAPGSITQYNSDEAFLTARSGGTANYSYLRGTFSRLLDLGTFTKHLDDFKLLVRGTGQWSNANLVASEQIGLGGQDSVRGYPERTMRGDHGIFIQTELYSPAFHPLRWLAKKVPDRWVDAADRTDELRFLIFYDYGWADVHQATAAEPGEILNASSLGIGLRYRINKSMTFRFDYGFQLERLDPRVVNSFDLSPKYSHHGDGYAHMGLSISF